MEETSDVRGGPIERCGVSDIGQEVAERRGDGIEAQGLEERVERHEVASAEQCRHQQFGLLPHHAPLALRQPSDEFAEGNRVVRAEHLQTRPSRYRGEGERDKLVALEREAEFALLAAHQSEWAGIGGEIGLQC